MQRGSKAAGWHACECAGGEGSGPELRGLPVTVCVTPKRSPDPFQVQLHRAQTPRSKEGTYIVCARSSEASPALFTDQSSLFKYLISTE